jgi:hypothetical protein
LFGVTGEHVEPRKVKSRRRKSIIQLDRFEKIMPCLVGVASGDMDGSQQVQTEYIIWMRMHVFLRLGQRAVEFLIAYPSHYGQQGFLARVSR